MTDEAEVVVPRRGRPRGKPVVISAPTEQAPALPASDGSLPRGVSDRAMNARRKNANIGGFNTRLHAKPLPGFVLRWVNDTEGRIENYLAKGWDYVTQGEQGIEQESTDPGNKVSRVCGSLPSGDAQRTYLMKIPEQWYNEDQKKEQAIVAKADEAIRRGLVNAKPGDNRYIPRAGISVKREDKPQ